jgi:hypothetical protein
MSAVKVQISALASPLPTEWQRCVVHFYRNVFSLVPSGKVRDVAKMLKAIHAQENRKAAAEKMAAVIADLRAMKLTKAAELLEESGHETLAYYGFPDSHWIKLRTNNPLERIMREIRRTDTDVHHGRWNTCVSGTLTGELSAWVSIMSAMKARQRLTTSFSRIATIPCSSLRVRMANRWCVSGSSQME